MTRKNIRKPKDDPNACVNCGDKSDKKDMVPCAGCERKFHWFCNDPPMRQKPTKRSHPTGWFCKDCNEDGKKDDEEEELALTAEPAKKRKVLSDDYHYRQTTQRRRRRKKNIEKNLNLKKMTMIIYIYTLKTTINNLSHSLSPSVINIKLLKRTKHSHSLSLILRSLSLSQIHRFLTTGPRTPRRAPDRTQRERHDQPYPNNVIHPLRQEIRNSYA